ITRRCYVQGSAASSLSLAGFGRTFFFQAEDGIRVLIVTGVQTCALPIYSLARILEVPVAHFGQRHAQERHIVAAEAGVERPGRKIGRASCRERARPATGVAVMKERDRPKNEQESGSVWQGPYLNSATR